MYLYIYIMYIAHCCTVWWNLPNSHLLGPSSGMRRSCGAGAWLGAFKAWREPQAGEAMVKSRRAWEKYGKMLALSTLAATNNFDSRHRAPKISGIRKKKWGIFGFYMILPYDWSNESAFEADEQKRHKIGYAQQKRSDYNQQENQLFERQKVIWRKQRWSNHQTCDLTPAQHTHTKKKKIMMVSTKRIMD